MAHGHFGKPLLLFVQLLFTMLRFYLSKISGLRMHRVTQNQFPILKICWLKQLCHLNSYFTTCFVFEFLIYEDQGF